MLDSGHPAIDCRSLRILITADAVGGVWQYTVDLVSGLSRAGHQLLVAVLGPSPTPEQKAQVANMTSVAVVEKNFALEWEDHPWSDVDASGAWLLELGRDFNADVIHLNGYSHASLPWKRPVVVVAHSCVFSWWKNVLNTVPDLAWMEYKRRVSAGLDACDVVVAPSQFMANEIHREYGSSHARTKVIYNFSAQVIAGVREKQPFALAAGRVWDRAKNFSLLEEIAADVRWPIHIAGEAKGTNETSAVSYMGRLPYQDLLSQLNRASIFVHPALYEPFGLSVLDAARSRCCLVLADTESMRELWGEAAILVHPRRPADWIRELNQLADNPALCDELGSKAFTHSARYRRDSSVNEYLALYAGLTAHSRQEAEEAA